jgi:hypothetical protein
MASRMSPLRLGLLGADPFRQSSVDRGHWAMQAAHSTIASDCTLFRVARLIQLLNGLGIQRELCCLPQIG